MALSRKHYEGIAKILHDSENKEEIKEHLKKMFAEENKRFDPEKFDKQVETGIISRSRKKLKEVVNY